MAGLGTGRRGPRAAGLLLWLGPAVLVASLLVPWSSAPVLSSRSGVEVARTLLAANESLVGSGRWLGAALLSVPVVAALVWLALALGGRAAVLRLLGAAAVAVTATLVAVLAARGELAVGPALALAGATFVAAGSAAASSPRSTP